MKEILTTLSSLQQRAKERDPLNAKKKERFVMGLKQVNLTIVFLKEIRLLILSNRVEQNLFFWPLILKRVMQLMTKFLC